MAYITIDTVAYRNTFLFGNWTDYTLQFDPATLNMRVLLQDGPDSRFTISEANRTKPNGTIIYPKSGAAPLCQGTTQYVVRSANYYPYMYLDSTPNASVCGYIPPNQTDPIPPPNPVYYNAYAIRYTLQFSDVHNNTPANWRVDILQGYIAGPSPAWSIIQLTGGAKPVVMQYQGNEQDKLAPIVGSQVTLNLINDGNLDLSLFYTADQKEYKVLIYRNNILYWAGFIVPDNCQQPWLAAPYEFSLKATDAIGLLKGIKYVGANNQLISATNSCLQTIYNCLQFTDLNLNIVTGVNVYEIANAAAVQAGTIPADPLQTTYVSYTEFIDSNGQPKDCYTVLSDIASSWGATILQSGGSWYIIRKNELSGSKIYLRNYGKDITTIPTPTQTDLSTQIGGNAATIHCNRDQLLRIIKATLSVEADFSYNVPSKIPLNCDFTIFDPVSYRTMPPAIHTAIGQNPYFWTQNGGIAANNIITVNDADFGGTAPLNPYEYYTALQIFGNYTGGSPSTDTQHVDSFPFNVSQGDSLSLVIKHNGILQIDFILDTGTTVYYALTNGNQGLVGWYTAYTSNQYKGDPFGNAGESITVVIPPFTADGKLTVKIHRSAKIGAVDMYFRIDSMTYNLGSDGSGDITILTQSGLFTDRQQKTLALGSSRHFAIAGSLLKMVSGQLQLAIRWFRIDRNTESRQFAEIFCQSILNMYGTPSRIFEGSLYGNTYEYANTLVINADATGVKYGFVNWDYDVKACINRATSIQLLDAEIPNTEQFIFKK